jgi:PAS domain S-box-containing protein
MNDKNRTKAQLLEEVIALRQRVAELEAAEVERKRMEAALRESEERYRTLLQKIRTAVVVHAADTRIVTSNPTAQELLGLTEDQMLGKTAIDLAWKFFREDGTVMPLEEYPVNQVLAAQQPLRDVITGVHRLATQDTVWVLVNADPAFDEKGTISQVIVTFVDITERKRTEKALTDMKALLEAAFEQTPIPMVLVSYPDMIIRIANSAGLEFLGVQDEPSYIGQSLFEFHQTWKDFDSQGNPMTIAQMPLALALQGITTKNKEFYVVRKDGAQRWELVSGAPIYNQCGEQIAAYIVFPDITDRKRAEETLRKREQEFKTLVENTPDVIARFDRAYRHIYVNPVVEKEFGSPPEKLLGKTHRELGQLPEMADRSERIIRQVFESGQEIVFELSVPTPAGVKYYLSRGVPEFAEDGSVATTLFIHRNITQRKKVEEALRETEERYRIITENIRDTVWLMDLNFRTTWISPSVVRTRGFTLEELANMPLEQHLTPDSLKLAQSVIASNMTPDRLADRSQEITLAVEFEFYRKDGSTFWGDTVVTILRDSAGSPYGFLCVGRDITERKRTEELLQQKTDELDRFFNLDLDLLCIADTDGYFHRLNLAWETTLGYTRAELKAKRFLDFVHPDDVASTLKALAQLSAQQTVMNFVNRYRCQDGTYRWIEWRSAPAGKMIYAAARDITERKQAEAEIRQLNVELEARVQQRTAELETANKELRDFVSIISHDLKTPLRGISQLAYWLVTDYAEAFDADGKEKVTLLINRVKRMNTMLEGILNYAKIGRIPVQENQFDLHRLVQDIIQEFAPPSEIQILIETPLPMIIGDPDWMTAVFTNLLENAIKFMDKPQGLVTIGCVDEETHWTFRVSDNGPGIAAQYHQKIFQMFQTLAAHDEHEDTGIGLALVKRIVEFYGGKIWVESTPGKGSTFFFTLPRTGRRQL